MNQDSGFKHACPNCSTKRENTQTQYGVVWTCSTCKGRALGVGLLQKISNPQLINQVWAKAEKENRKGVKPCPACKRAMLIVTTGPQLGSIELDVCHNCFFVWFDNQELEKIPRATDQEIEKRIEAARPKPSANKSSSSSILDSIGNGGDDDDGLDGIGDLLSSLFRW
jgi:Zn-finger nucleic acid-binding protein